jgi:hypothetical protein
MKVKPILILSVLLILLAGATYLFLKVESGGKADNRPIVWSVDERTIERIRVQLPREGRSVAFFKDKDDKWFFEDKDELAVDTKRWGGIVQLVSEPKSKRMIAEKMDDLTQYELNNPRMIVTLTIQNRKEPLEILFGRQTPQGDQYYVKLKNSPPLYIMHDTYCEVLMRLAQEPPFPPPSKAVHLKQEEGKNGR